MKRSRKILLSLVSLLLACVLAAVGLILHLWIHEYRPAAEEPARLVSASTPGKVQRGQELSILTYNIGYAALGKQQDFFMDGGQMVRPDSPDVIRDNLHGILNELQHLPSDFYFLQEVDEEAKRSYSFNEVDFLTRSLDLGYTFAYNFVCPYVPYPLPTIGKVQAGLLTLSGIPMYDAKRVALPVPFSWPVRLANLKRCLLVSRVAIEGTDKELVLVNLHLEAYDNGSGKIEQTRALRSLLEQEYAKGNYVIAGGDWNQVLPGAPSPAVPEGLPFVPGRVEPQDLPDHFQTAIDPSSTTSRLLNQPYEGHESDTPLFSLDGFVVSPNVEIVQVQAMNTGYQFSDHLPVRMQFKLKTDSSSSSSSSSASSPASSPKP